MTEQLKLPGGAWHYERAGDGPLVVLYHAFGPPGWGWPLARLQRHCTVVALGRLDVDDPNLVFAQPFLPPLLEQLEFGTATLCPWSMAGPSVLRYASGSPPELEKLVLVDVVGLRGPLPASSAGANVPATPEEWARAAAANWVRNAGPVRDLVERLTLQSTARTPQSFQRNQEVNRRSAAAPPMFGALESITVPTLVLTGRYSRVLGPEAATASAQRLPDSRVVIFEKSAHALALEEPEKFQDLVAEFVTGRPAPRPTR